MDKLTKAEILMLKNALVRQIIFYKECMTPENADYYQPLIANNETLKRKLK